MTGIQPLTPDEDFSRFRPTEAEVLYGGYLGQDPETTPLPSVDRALSPLRALEDAIRPSLAREPCVVSFSGGRDSSLILCVAARLAEREGWSPPVPVTLHFSNVGRTGEDRWQELVVRHLGLTNWTRLSFSDELGALGPFATGVLKRFGVLVPPNLYFHVPLFEAARRGALLTGVGGDEVFDSGPSRLGLVVSRRDRPRRHDLVRLAVVAAPTPLRVSGLRRRRRVTYPWLQPAARRWLTDLVARQAAAMPELWHRALRHWWASRYVQGAHRCFAAVGADHGVVATHPFLDPTFLQALSVTGGPGGYTDRTTALGQLFADVLPAEVAGRADKAVFDAAVFGAQVSAFAEKWAGQGLDPTRVDIAELRRMWMAGEWDYRTLLLLHQAWLAASPLARGIKAT